MMPAIAPAGADHRRLGLGPGEAVREGGGDAAGEIEDEEADMADVVLDIVAEDPEEHHVADEVHRAACRNIAVMTVHQLGR